MIVSDAELSVGDVVYKHYKPEDKGYSLPGKYQKGGGEYNGDLNDYYHIGVVTAVHPIRISHMTTPTSKIDTKLGKWSHFGRLKIFEGKQENSGGEKMSDRATIGGGNQDKPINMRAAASKNSMIISRIPQGSEVDLISYGNSWCEIGYNGQKGYVKTEFVHSEADDEDFDLDSPNGLDLDIPGGDVTIRLTAEEAAQILPVLYRIAKQIDDAVAVG